MTYCAVRRRMLADRHGHNVVLRDPAGRRANYAKQRILPNASPPLLQHGSVPAVTNESLLSGLRSPDDRHRGGISPGLSMDRQRHAVSPMPAKKPMTKRELEMAAAAGEYRAKIQEELREQRERLSLRAAEQDALTEAARSLDKLVSNLAVDTVDNGMNPAAAGLDLHGGGDHRISAPRRVGHAPAAVIDTATQKKMAHLHTVVSSLGEENHMLRERLNKAESTVMEQSDRLSELEVELELAEGRAATLELQINRRVDDYAVVTSGPESENVSYSTSPRASNKPNTIHNAPVTFDTSAVIVGPLPADVDPAAGGLNFADATTENSGKPDKPVGTQRRRSQTFDSGAAAPAQLRRGSMKERRSSFDIQGSLSSFHRVDTNVLSSLKRPASKTTPAPKVASPLQKVVSDTSLAGRPRRSSVSYVDDNPTMLSRSKKSVDTGIRKRATGATATQGSPTESDANSFEFSSSFRAMGASPT
jgi:hypothetical protein